MRRMTLTIVLLAGMAPAAVAQSAPAAPTAPAPAKADTPAPATDTPTADRPGRFSFNRVDDGFLRLDNQTGQVAYCTSRTIGWACQMVPEDRAALEKEIARLQDEVAALKAQVAALREPPPPPANAPPPADNSEQTTHLRDDLERARAAFENAWRRLVDMIVALQRDMLRKGS